jgi:hypothetical protein
MLGATTDDYIYVTQDEFQLERRLEEASIITFDYDLKTMEKRALEDSIFAPPSYCHKDKPTKCPLTSMCAIADEGEGYRFSERLHH